MPPPVRGEGITIPTTAHWQQGHRCRTLPPWLRPGFTGKAKDRRTKTDWRPTRELWLGLIKGERSASPLVSVAMITWWRRSALNQLQATASCCAGVHCYHGNADAKPGIFGPRLNIAKFHYASRRSSSFNEFAMLLIEGF